MIAPLDVHVDGPFTTRAVDASPSVDESSPGLVLAVTDIARDGDRVRMNLHFAYGFADSYFMAFKDIRRAIVVAMQDAATGETVTFPLLDPTKNDLEPIIENFQPPGKAPPVAFARGWASVPVDVRAFGGDLLVRASLQGHVSNLVRVPAPEAS